MPATKEQIKATLRMVALLGQAIKEAKSIPSGVLYAYLCGNMSIDDYEGAIRLLVKSGVVDKSPGHILTWIG